MAAPLTPDEHEVKKWEAYRLSLQGRHAPAIADRIEVSVTTTKALLREARREIARERKEKGHSDLEVFLGEQDAVLADAWQRLQAFPSFADSKIIPDLQTNALAASVNKGKVLGLFVDKVEHSGSLDLLMKLLSKPQTVVVPEHPDVSDFE